MPGCCEGKVIFVGGNCPGLYQESGKKPLFPAPFCAENALHVPRTFCEEETKKNARKIESDLIDAFSECLIQSFIVLSLSRVWRGRRDGLLSFGMRCEDLAMDSVQG